MEREDGEPYRAVRAVGAKVKVEVNARYLAYKDPGCRGMRGVFAAVVVAHAFRPLDLIPDPIPVLGYLDDLVLIPLGIALAIRMIPAPVLAECREEGRNAKDSPVGSVAAVAVWIVLAALALWIVTLGF